jgi:uncharacterized protein YqeY
MNIETRINEDIITAMKERNAAKKSILVTIKGEIQTMKKNLLVDSLGDDESLKILNRFTKGLNENLKTENKNNAQDAYELEIIGAYCPKLMSEAEITERIQALIASGVNNIGGIMGAFKGLLVDMKTVSTLYKTLV